MTETLKARLARAPAVLAPGVYDSLTALLVEQAGFEAAYLSGGSIAYTQLGRPDLGLLSLEHLSDVVTRIRERVALPLIVDADTGFGNALNVQRTVRRLERAGANAIQLEDQAFPKRCGHLAGKTLISAAEMAGKIAAAVDARHDADTLIVGRTDAVGVEGLEAALERAERYVDAGADILFLEAPRTLDDLHLVVRSLAHRAPLLANMVEGGHTPLLSCEELSAIGFRIVIAPGAIVRAIIPTVEALLQSMQAEGSSQSFRSRMVDLAGVNRRVGLAESIAATQNYDPAFQSAE